MKSTLSTIVLAAFLAPTNAATVELVSGGPKFEVEYTSEAKGI